MSRCKSLHFRLFHDRFHLFVCHDLIVSPKAKCLVQRVRKVCSCITGNIARAFDLLKVHALELADDFFAGEVAFQSLLKHPVEDQRQKAGHEVRLDPLIPAQIDRPGLELAFHDPEAFLNLPAPLVNQDDLRRLVSQARAHGIEAIVHRLLGDHFLVEAADCFIRQLPFRRAVCPGDKALIVILICMGQHPFA